MKLDLFTIAMKVDPLSSYPSPRVAVGREGRSEAKARVGGASCTPTPMLVSLASTLPTRGREERARPRGEAY